MKCAYIPIYLLFCSKLGIKVSKLNIDKCPLCGGEQFEKVMTCTDHYASGESFEVHRCVHCHFLFTQNVPSETEIGRYYQSPDYISHTDTTKGLMNKVYHWVRNYMLDKKAALVKRVSLLPNTGKLLDIGTGTGYFSHAMQQRGWEVSAIEKSPQARQFAKDHFGLLVDSEDKLSSYPAESFHVITLWHVMEHLEHLNETWERLKVMLKKEGTLIVAVPNYTSYDAQHYGAWWAAYDVPRHLWHFSPDTMKQFADKHGFECKEILPMPFDAFYVSMLTEKYRGKRFSFFRGCITGLKALLSARANNERSSSLIYVFRKK